MRHKIRTLLVAVLAFALYAVPAHAEGGLSLSFGRPDATKVDTDLTPSEQDINSKSQLPKPSSLQGAGKGDAATSGGSRTLPPRPPVSYTYGRSDTSRMVPPPPQSAPYVPSNEQLAIQITNLRLNVLGLNRDMTNVKKEIRKMKMSMVARKPRSKTVVASARVAKRKAKARAAQVKAVN
ncbi:hypothetical protein L4X63_07770 [Geomonas sp. Red32]|uniref:hypothetical protein n=1 Tax=Geomonas sp. Red32 TaxID=2912856 RepID=UPI00202CF643|nr:hypothetical protein [Geomonas sp. Red32]MCM0081481.1 hypothetical protein [Geomonas sp. Red32]